MTEHHPTATLETEVGAKLYRIGLTADCPVHQVSLGGRTFAKRTEKVEGYGADTRRTDVRGSFEFLTDQDVARIKENASKRVIRATSGDKKFCRVYATDNRRYRRLGGDEPLARYVYVEQVEESASPYGEYRPATIDQQASTRVEAEPSNERGPGGRFRPKSS
jgi:hypothetical protein